MILKLIGDLLRNLEVRDSDLEYEFERVNICALLEQVCDEMYERAEKREMEIALEGEDKECMVEMDRKQMRYVLENLIGNAIKYGYEDSKVRVDWHTVEDNVKIAVTNKGLGIPEEEQDKVFQRFHRASNVANTETTGSGLGLSISKRIVKGHNGKIWFESEPQKETTFYVSVPKKQS